MKKKRKNLKREKRQKGEKNKRKFFGGSVFLAK